MFFVTSSLCEILFQVSMVTSFKKLKFNNKNLLFQNLRALCFIGTLMKNILGGVIGLLVLISSQVHASINDLFISEYVEGSGYNKAIELFNGKTHSIDLSDYQLAFYLNGSKTASFNVELSGTLSAYTTFVVANSLASSQILIVSDQTRNGIWFDGDDVVALIHKNQIIDSIGQVGIESDKAWGRRAQGDNIGSLRRLPTEKVGDVDIHDKVDLNRHWKDYGSNNFDGLGSYILLDSSAGLQYALDDKVSYHQDPCLDAEAGSHYC